MHEGLDAMNVGHKNPKWLLVGAVGFTLLLIVTACGSGRTPAPTPTSTPSDTAPPTPAPTPSPTGTATLTAIPAVTSTPSLTPLVKVPATVEADLTRTQIRAVFALHDGDRVNVYSSNLDGSDRKLLISEDGIPPSGDDFPNLSFHVQLSDDGNTLAYKLSPSRGYTWYAPSPVYLIEVEEQRKANILEGVGFFYLSPDGTRIIYRDPSYQPQVWVGSPPPRSPGLDWRMFNTQSGSDELIVPHDKLGHGFSWFGAWLDDDHVLFLSTRLTGLDMFALDLSTTEAIEVVLPEPERHLVPGEVLTNPSGTRTVLSFRPFGEQFGCEFYELTRDWKIGNHIVSDKNYACEGIAWNGDNEIYYGKGTGPKGRISTAETSESGYYILLSIYKYDFETGTEEPVLTSDGSEVYRFQGVLENEVLVVSNESNRRSPRYIVEFRDLDGNNPVTFFSGNRKMLWLGWIR